MDTMNTIPNKDYFSEDDATIKVDGTDSDGSSHGHSTPKKRKSLSKRRATLAVDPEENLSEEELQVLRLKVNGRERRRMHDLNTALDGLREVMPYANGPSVRKLSKIATLLLAKNYILMLNSSLEEMKKLVSDVYANHPARASTPVPHVQHLARGQLPVVPGLPLLSNGVSSVNGLTHHEISAISPIPSKECTTINYERNHILSRWPSPCACSQCAIQTGRHNYPPNFTHKFTHLHSLPGHTLIRK